MIITYIKIIHWRTVCVWEKYSIFAKAKENLAGTAGRRNVGFSSNNIEMGSR